MNIRLSAVKRFFGLYRGLIGLAAVSLLVMLIAYLVKGIVLIPPGMYLPFHLIVELSSIIISFAVFTTAWYGYKQSGAKTDMLIGGTFFAAGFVDLVHTLSYQGMSDFLGPASPGKAAAYWLLARLIVGVGLLTASLIRDSKKADRATSSLVITTLVVSIGSVITLLTVYGDAAAHLFFDPVTKLTSLKIALEVLIISLYAATFVALANNNQWEAKTVRLLRTAMVWAILAELSFMLYQSPYGIMNALGHIMKIAAYYYIFCGLFASAVQKPYNELSRAKNELVDLYAHAQEHRIEIERSFSRIGSALSMSLRLDQALDQIAKLAADILYADWSIVVSMDETHRMIQISARDEGAESAQCPVELAKRTSELMSTDPQTILINNLSCIGLMNEPGEPEPRSTLSVPMIFDRKVLGMISVYSKAADMFDEDDVRLMEGFASHAAVAVHNAISYEHESRIADALQRAILASSDIKADKFEISHVYEPAMNEALVGGDFFDVIELPDKKIGLVIGDVSGKGLKSAVYTAMVKYSLRAYANQNLSSLESIKLLDKVLESHTGADVFVTMFYGILDTQTGELIFTNAGHEQPVYSKNGINLTLPPTGPALGLGLGVEFSEGRVILEPKSLLLLYTDGISEARHDHEFLGIEGLSDRIKDCDGMTSAQAAKYIYDVALDFARGPLKDDVAILTVRALD